MPKSTAQTVVCLNWPIAGGDRVEGGDTFEIDIIRQEHDEGVSKRNVLLFSDEARARIEDLSNGMHSSCNREILFRLI